jgi:hypothetical protein
MFSFSKYPDAYALIEQSFQCSVEEILRSKSRAMLADNMILLLGKSILLRQLERL